MDPELDDLDPGSDASKGSKMPVLIAAVVALVLGAAGGAGAMRFMGGDEAEAAETEAPDPIQDKGRQLDPIGSVTAASTAVVNLGGFPVNLRGAGGGRVLRLEVQVQVDAEHAPLMDAEEPHPYRAPLQDAILLLASDYTYADLEGIEGKTRLRDEMLGRLNAVVAPDGVRIERIYFTQFVVQ